MSEEKNVGVSDPQPADEVKEQPSDVAGAEPATAETTEDVAARAEEYLRLAQRAQADLVNYRRRVDQERDEIRAAAKIDAVTSLLPILDDFERAIAAIPEDHRQLGWVQGILLIERNLRAVVERAGLERIEAQGKPFDPWEHEAVLTEESAEHEDNTVTQVIRPGYRSGKKVVRPAQVAVSRRPNT
jgi:molecular chaperone GrpE